MIMTIGSEDGQKRQKEFFKAELTRLQRSLKDESSKITKPKQLVHDIFLLTCIISNNCIIQNDKSK